MARDDLFTVVHEQFLTDTAKYADIVLPATTHIEANDVTPAWGHLWMGWNEAAIEPLGEAVNNSECFRRIAQAMGLTEPLLYDDDMSVLKAALPTVDLDAMRRDGWVRVPFPEDGVPWADGGFPTPSGKVEFVSDRLARDGHPALPTFTPSGEGPRSARTERFPLQLMTPKHHTRFLNSGYSHLPKHGPAEGGPFVEDGKLGPGGSLPTNTGGGELSGYYMWGMTPLSEAVMQGRGQGGERQAPNDLILCTGNGGNLSYHAALVLSPERNA